MHSMTLLNEHGDITLHWDDTNHDRMIKMIETKLKQGHKFFIIKKKLGFIPIKSRIHDVSNVKNTIIMSDDTMSDLLSNGVGVSHIKNHSYDISHVSNDPYEIATNDTIASRAPIKA